MKDFSIKLSELIISIFSKLIKAYKILISPLIGDCCRFHPTCSDYCLECLTKHGVIKGLALGLFRVLRCNKFSAGGFDPVPNKE